MLIYAFILTFILGAVFGIFAFLWIAVQHEQRVERREGIKATLDWKDFNANLITPDSPFV